MKDSGISAIYKASPPSSSLWINNYNLNFPSCSTILRPEIIIKNFSFNFFPIIFFIDCRCENEKCQPSGAPHLAGLHQGIIKTTKIKQHCFHGLS